MIYKNPNAYQEKVNQDPRNSIDVVVGDDKQTPFQPQVKLMRWSNEHNLSIRLGGLPHDNRNLIRDYAGMIEYGDEKKKMRTYKKQYNNQDAWEMEWILYKHPGTYTEELTLQIKNLEFYKQPPLNEEITPGEGETVTATHHYDADGNVLAHRPEDVVGSYAVYLSRGKAWNRQSPNMAMWYKLQDEYNSRDAGNEPNPSFAHLDTVSKLSAEISKYEALSTPELPYNKTYMTGKFCHIYRPKLIDANGNEAYADIDINRETALMTITYPKTFLDNAQYPVTVDPTFGYTSVGGTTEVAGGNRAHASLNAPADGDGTVDKMTIYFTKVFSSNINAKGVLWNSSTLAVITNGVTEQVSLTSTNWFDLNFGTPPSVVDSTNYYVGGVFGGATGAGTNVNYDTLSSAGYLDAGNSLSSPTTLDDDVGGTGVVDRNYSIYATYTASGGGSSFTPRNSTVI